MKLLKIENGRLAYWESGSGAPVLFIHGVATTGELWAGDLEPLAAHCRLIVYDRRGYGRSSESPRSWQAHREDAAALLDRLAATPAVVIGYSAGANIALDLALSRPERVAALVLVDAAFNLTRSITPGLIKM